MSEPQQLPKPGEVWGVTDKPTTWQFITGVSHQFVHIEAFGAAGEITFPTENWRRLAYFRIFPKDTP